MSSAAIVPIETDSLQKIVWLRKSAFSQGTMVNATDTNWNTSRALITHVKVATDAENWRMLLYSDSNWSSGMYGTGFIIAYGAMGSKIINLGSLPYIDNNGANQMHFKIFDADEYDDYIVTFYGVRAR